LHGAILPLRAGKEINKLMHAGRSWLIWLKYGFEIGALIKGADIFLH
jgi:hypothetical protein